jgi:NADH-quinone oxidoreductase subunit E
MATSSTSSTSTVDGVAPNKTDLTRVDRILGIHNHDCTELIAILLDVQDELGYLPVEAMVHISERLDYPVTEIFGIATFYKHFELEPPARHQFTVCTGTACHVRGAMRILRELERQLGIDTEVTHTTPDLKFGLKTVNCVGACALGPVVIAGKEFKGQVRPTRIKGLIRRTVREQENPSA